MEFSDLKNLCILISLVLCLVANSIDGVSQWDPFCQEDTLYAPYVRVFQKGRNGLLLRDRGPGFIDVNGLKDIYICTNGLVMLYYLKSRKMGDVFEQGELHWAPHHCELYNPSCTTLAPDHPRKTLLSLLLIGHPNDYRRPALQMFISPTFDKIYGNYVNITSLIMVGSDGECLVEKGVERARLRVRVSEPEAVASMKDKPAIFCQLDAQRKLGQRGVITIKKPDEYPEKKDAFLKSPYETPKPNQKIETGSSIIPRFKASEHPIDPKYDDILARAADDVYTALLSDRKMRFVGCLRYPDYSLEQERIIRERSEEFNGPVGGTAPPEIKLVKEYVPDETDPPFWKESVVTPWSLPSLTASPSPEERFKAYIVKWDLEDYAAINVTVKTAEDALAAAKPLGVADAIATAEAELKKANMMLSLWPLKTAYIQLMDYTASLEAQVKTAWTKIYDEQVKTDDTIEKLDDPATLKVNVTAYWKQEALKQISQTKYDRRFEPYSPKLIEEYDNYTNLSVHLTEHLRDKSIKLGPLISNAEILYTRYKTYKGLMKKALTDIENGIKFMEKKGRPVDVVNPGNVFDRYFTDTLIDIADHAADPAAFTPAMQACYALPAFQETCKGIKPAASRTCQLLKNRLGKGAKFWPPDEWRLKIFDLLESVFKKACPYIADDFAISINRIIRGYLMAEPIGTGLMTPINGSRLYSADNYYQEKVYNLTYAEMNRTDKYIGTLRPKDPFWDLIITALEECHNKINPMEFWHNEEGDRPPFITLRKTFANNGSDSHFDVEDLYMQEKADLEYTFNWAVDSNWRIFATVLGICMPQYENKIPLISARFYALYTQDFLHPLRQVWMSNRDNAILKVILGSFYGTGKGDRWSKVCMESSFVESGDRSYRPPRGLYVNAFTEMNYFTSGPMSGTSGKLTEML